MSLAVARALAAATVVGWRMSTSARQLRCATATSVSRHYLTAGGTVIGMLQSVGMSITLSATAPPTITSIALNKVEYWHQNHLGSLIATTDHTGAVTARYSYDPFGKHRYPNGAYDMNGVLIADYTTATSSGTPRGFTGHEELDDIGLINMNGRLYDPVLGRFVQADPFVQFVDSLQSFNRYSYVFNNPLRHVDRSGFEGEDTAPEEIVINGTRFVGDVAYEGGMVLVTVVGSAIHGFANIVTSIADAIGCFLFGCDATPRVEFHVVNGPTRPTTTLGSNLQLTQAGQTSPNISGYGSDAPSGTVGGPAASTMGTGNTQPQFYPEVGTYTQCNPDCACFQQGNVTAVDAGGTEVITNTIARAPIGVYIDNAIGNFIGWYFEWTAEGRILQSDFAALVNGGLYNGDVNILSGVHGFANGTTVGDFSLYEADVATFGTIPGVNVYNVPAMTPGQISGVLNGPGTTIGAFCDSGACLLGR